MFPRARERVEEICGSFEIHTSYGAESIAAEKRAPEVAKRHVLVACSRLLRDPKALHRCWHADEPEVEVPDMPFDEEAEDLMFSFRSEFARVLRLGIKGHRDEAHQDGAHHQVSEGEVGEYISHFIMDEEQLRSTTRVLMVQALREAMVQVAALKERREQESHDPLEEEGTEGVGGS